MIPRYETPEIKKIWTDQNRFGRWLDVELAATRAWHEEGVVPDEDYKNIVEKAGFSVERIHEIEEVTQHDVIAFVSSVAETIGESGRFVHLGLTSSDVIDTASSLLLGESLDVVIAELEKLHKLVGEKAVEYKMTPCAGRTHGVHAEPTTFGLKLLNHYSEIGRDIERLKQTKQEMMVGKLSGAVGTYANCPPKIEARVCELLGLKIDPVATQVIQRDRHARVVTDMAIAGGTLERLALEIRHLQRTEVLEALEPFKKGQKGSSAMPHKKNPILCERVCGMSRLLRGYAVPALENIALWHERDISHSSVERVMWPDAFHLLHYMTKKMIQIVSGMAVDTQKMRENMDITKGLLFSGRVLIELVEHEGISREDAYAIAQSNAMRCWNEKVPLLDLLKSDERITNMSASELESLFDLEYYLKHIEEVFGRFPELCGAGASEPTAPGGIFVMSPDRNLALEMVRATEAAAMAAGRWMGRGDKNGVDGAAVNAMRFMLNTVEMDGVIVIGEGEKDEAPMLFNGEKLGRGTEPQVDIAVDPIDGTRLTAYGLPNAVSVVAFAERGTMYNPQHIFYMDKIATGPYAAHAINIEASPTDNIRAVARALRKSVEDVTVVVLDRPRHEELIKEIRSIHARIRLIPDGDVAGALSTCKPNSGIDLLMGVGGSPEAIITACAIKCIGGNMQCKLWPRNDEDREKCKEKGMDVNKVLHLNDLVKSENVFFAATGVTDGDWLRGVRYTGDGIETMSLVMRAKSGTLRYVNAVHNVQKLDEISSIKYGAQNNQAYFL